MALSTVAKPFSYHYYQLRQKRIFKSFCHRILYYPLYRSCANVV